MAKWNEGVLSGEEVDPDVLGPSNFVQEAPGVWSVYTIEPDSLWLANTCVSKQIKGKPAVLQDCAQELETLKAAGVIDDNLKFLKPQCFFPNRCIIYKLSGGGALCFSVSKLLEGMKEFLDSLGGVKAVIPAHGFNLLSWKEAWPDALWFETGQVAAKDAALRKQLPIAWDLRNSDPANGYRACLNEAPQEVQDVLEDFQVYAVPVMFGMFREIQLYHSASRTLASPDLLYNGDLGGDINMGGLGFPTKDPVKLAAASLWYKANWLQHGSTAKSKHLPQYRLFNTMMGLVAHMLCGCGPKFDDGFSKIFGKRSQRSQMEGIDSLCKLPMEKIITCHCRRNPVGKECRQILKDAWAFGRNVQGGCICCRERASTNREREELPALLSSAAPTKQISSQVMECENLSHS